MYSYDFTASEIMCDFTASIPTDCSLNDWLNNGSCFSVPFIALDVDVIDRHGPSEEMRR